MEGVVRGDAPDRHGSPRTTPEGHVRVDTLDGERRRRRPALQRGHPGQLVAGLGRVALTKNPRHKNLVADTRLGLSRLKAEKAPDIVLPNHAQSFFEGKVEQARAGVRPHPLLNGDKWVSDIMEAEASLESAV